jgi:hypothetical protein
MYPVPLFSQKHVAALWSKFNRENWYLDDDEIESARKVIAQHRVKHSSQPWEVQEIPITLWKDSFKVFAFEVTSILDIWEKDLKEVAIDSACERCFDIVSLLRIHAMTREYKWRRL